MLELAPHLEAALRAGHTLVVPTAQRAAALRLGFAVQQLAAGQRAFRTPDVQSLNGWLRGQPRMAVGGHPLRLPGASEEWLLWRDAVAEAAARLSLPWAAGLVDAMRQSATLLFEWCIDPDALRRAGSPEAALLAESLAAMNTRLTQLSAAAPWSALQQLAHDPPGRIPAWAGFAFHTPARRALLAAWAQRGAAAPEYSGDFAAGAARIALAADPAAELAAAAQWCAERLSTTPGARLLVIVPELAQRHAEVRRVFDAVLDPGYLERGAAAANEVMFALEGAPSLRSYAPISDALRALQGLTQAIELSELSQWLRGASWRQPDAARRAQLDVWLRGVVPPRLNARQLLQALRAAPAPLLAYADEVAAVISRALDALGGPRATLADWSAGFGRVLGLLDLTAGAARQRGSHTQQVLQRLDELLQECATLPAALGQFDAVEALALFTQLLTRTRFEPASGDAAVTLTASFADPILRYDGIWVSGLHAGAIPQHARFDPFIPAALQRQAGVIAADAGALVDQAQQALATLSRRCHEFILSAPARSEDQELAASPLLAPYAAHPYVPTPRYAEELPHTIRASRRIERYEDAPGLAWAAGVPLPAGTRAVELQSRCPFRAYAQLRLAADPLESPLPGISPRERGRMLHRALELLWQRLGGSAGLGLARTAGSLNLQIDDCIAQAAAEILRGTDPDGAEDEAFSAAADATGLLELRRAAITRELGRAGRLIRALCELEATRAPFGILELETAHRLEIAGALINVRIDRVDRLEDGSHVILDYKSGRAVNPDWEVERTTHPQLLVYLQAAGVPVSALAVAHLDPKGVVFKGVGDQHGRLPDVTAAGDWAMQLAGWRQQVAQLAGDFVRGHARVEPMDGACDHCHLHAFCRIADVGGES
ncbi:MAG TPA: PD-(D/E)XK nuclease family protein [Steroidobacteraceae bacterium]|nr:PD-(D/E)XK nuclease family protein [Steroidobacteraceae bacterium]